MADPTELAQDLRDACAPEYVGGKPTASAHERMLFEAADLIDGLYKCVKAADAVVRISDRKHDAWDAFKSERRKWP